MAEERKSLWLLQPHHFCCSPAMSRPRGGDSLLVSDEGGQTFFRFVKCCLVYLWVRDFEHNRYIFGVENLTRLGFSPKYCRAVAESAIKHLIFMYYEAMSIFLGSTNVLISVYFGLSIFLGSKNFLNLVYFWVFQKYPVSDPPSHTNRSPPLGSRSRNI